MVARPNIRAVVTARPRNPIHISHNLTPVLAGVSGLGEYPGYYCYDANRPSWLPYWIDDIAESMCKWSPTTMAGNVSACVAGDPSCPKVLSTPFNPNPTGAVANPNVSGGGIDPANQCGWFQSYNPQTGQCEYSLTSNTTMLAIAGLVLVVLLRR